MFAHDIFYIENHDAALSDKGVLANIRERIGRGDICIARGVYKANDLARMQNYLSEIGRHSLPNYYPIEEGCPNFHRLNMQDKRSYVKGCFHQFSFFPWNQDLFRFFDFFKTAFYGRNLLNNLPKEKFMGVKPEEGCAARLSFQFYPQGIGELNKHRDPVDFHQTTAPILFMSQKGVDFKDGGSYVEKESGEILILDDFTHSGDIVYYNAQIPHGVLPIDPNTPPNWLSFKGRWALLFAINKLASNTMIADAVDLTRSK